MPSLHVDREENSHELEVGENFSKQVELVSPVGVLKQLLR